MAPGLRQSEAMEALLARSQGEEILAGMPKEPLISIVDDDEPLRSSLENLIRSFGFRTQGFPSAEAFLAWTQAKNTACLILDVRMPGMNGLDLQSHMVRGQWQVPIIFITSHADDDAHARAMEAGAVAFLYKPCREEDLVDAIGAALRRPRDPEEP
jgi:FixJ family two-component response regulator